MKKAKMAAALMGATLLAIPAITASAEETYNIGYSNLSMKEDFFITVENGIHTACENKGYTYNTTVSDNDSAKMNQNIDALLTKGADIIISFDVLPEVGQAEAEELKKEGIPMISIDCDYGKDAYFFGVDNHGAGEALGNALVPFVADRFEEKVDYIVAVWNAQSGDTVKQRCTGAIEVLQDKYDVSDDNIVWLDCNGDDIKTQSMTEDWLGANPDAGNIVFIGQSDDRGYAINQAVIKSDRVEDCLIGSHNADPSVVENFQKYAKKPEETSWVTSISYNSYSYGEQVVQYAADILNGDAADEMQRYAQITALTVDNVEEYVAERDAAIADFIK